QRAVQPGHREREGGQGHVVVREQVALVLVVHLQLQRGVVVVQLRAGQQQQVVARPDLVVLRVRVVRVVRVHAPRPRVLQQAQARHAVLLRLVLQHQVHVLGAGVQASVGQQGRGDVRLLVVVLVHVERRGQPVRVGRGRRLLVLLRPGSLGGAVPDFAPVALVLVAALL
ncbi:unnamed protein product, partial [Heterosigma akashiwo]